VAVPVCTDERLPGSAEIGSPTGSSVARRRAVGVLRVIAAYAFAGWGYIALNAVVHPETLSLPLTHLASWPREDNFGVVCFVVSVAAAIAAKVLEVGS